MEREEKIVIFCVDNDNSIRELEIYALATMGLSASGFLNETELFEALKKEVPELIILDVMLSGNNEMGVLKKLRENVDFKNIPIIITSENGNTNDKIKGLNLGADDYIVKPFGIMEMVARVKAVLRRTVKRDIVVGNIVVSEAAHQVFVNSEKVELTQKEFELLVFFAKNKNVVFSRDKIMQEVWKNAYTDKSKIVDRSINRLRHKLGSAGGQIQTVIGTGYRLESEK